MRVIAGKYKRTPLLTLDSLKTRPTKDMVKEALFSSIDVENKNFLDLFSGSGAIGIEAVSREANVVVFNDLNKDACKIIKSNLDKIKETRTIYNLDYVSCLNTLKGQTFDYMYVDPPYAFKHYDDVFDLAHKNDLLNEGGKIIVEVRKDVNLLDDYNCFYKYKEKKYGISKLLYYRKANDD